MAPAERVVAVGGSAGGLEALRELAAGLPPDLPAAVLAVLHLPSTATSRLDAILRRSGPLPAFPASHGDQLEAGRIYVGPPDRHLIVHDHRVLLSRAPRENGVRPAIDPLLRSAGRQFGSRSVGVVLSGLLDDGSMGLLALRRRGGIGIVQDPATSAYPSMPENAIELAGPEHVVPAGRMGELISDLTRRPLGPAESNGHPQELPEEGATMEKQQTTWGDDRPGRPTGFSCPECNGVLWEVDEADVPSFQCRIGHRLSPESLLESQSSQLEGALWAAVRALEEQCSLTDRLAGRAEQRGDTLSAGRFGERAATTRGQIQVLRHAILTGDEEVSRRGG